jgi:hypothetical protein
MIRVERNEVAFQPVTLVIESQNDLDTFEKILKAAYDSTPRYSDEETMAQNLLSEIAGGGWQSSSASC